MNRNNSSMVIGVVVALVIVVATAGILGYSVLSNRNRLAPVMSPSPSPSLSAAASPSPTESPTASPTASPTESASPNIELPSPSPSPSGPPRVRALEQREIFGFLPYWHMGDPQTQVPLDTLTTIAIFGVEAGRDGHLIRQTSSGRAPSGWTAWDGPVTTSLIARAHAAKVRVVLTVQRFSWTSSQAKRTVALLTDPAKRQVLVSDILSELAAKHADGVNLDFEPVPASVDQQFLDFVRELRAGFDAAHPGLQLTFDTTTDIGSWDLPALTADDAADAALLMGYDFRTAAAPVAGSVDPLASTSSGSLTTALDEALAVIPPDHLILGLPWYGRAWSTQGAAQGAATLSGGPFPGSATVEFGDASDQAVQFGRNYDPTEASAWTVYMRRACASCPVVFRQLWYDDVDAMITKQSLVVDQNLRGLGIWALGDDHALPDGWAAIKVSLGGLVDTTAPTGTARVDTSSATKRHGNLPIVGPSVNLALTATDEAGGSGVAFVRLGTDQALAPDGSLQAGITYPASTTLAVPLSDARLVPAVARGQAQLFVQWRDVSGNWSPVDSVTFWVSTLTPGPSPSSQPSPIATEAPSYEPAPSEGPSEAAPSPSPSPLPSPGR